jgi:hypothetical protein
MDAAVGALGHRRRARVHRLANGYEPVAHKGINVHLAMMA